MSAQPALVRRLRTTLDCILIFLLILVASANHLPVQAQTELQPAARSTQVTEAASPALRDLNEIQPGPDQPLVDMNTLAGMIAAENAALTLPIYFIDLPLVTR